MFRKDTQFDEENGKLVAEIDNLQLIIKEKENEKSLSFEKLSNFQLQQEAMENDLQCKD